VVPEKDLEQIEAVRQRHETKLMSLDGVVGLGIGKSKSANNKLCIKVYVEAKKPKLEELVPKEIEGFAVEIEEVGEIIAY